MMGSRTEDTVEKEAGCSCDAVQTVDSRREVVDRGGNGGSDCSWRDAVVC